jgi:hypothetical protein
MTEDRGTIMCGGNTDYHDDDGHEWQPATVVEWEVNNGTRRAKAVAMNCMCGAVRVVVF